MKRILGLDLGTTSIGWALVDEAENNSEKSSIIKLGVRVNPLSVDEKTNFEQGKPISTTADRTLKRGMRRNLQRYKQRRSNLIDCLKQNGIIKDDTILCENGNATTFQTYRLRARAVNDEISLDEFARVLLMINKKRGYKSNRKAQSADEGQQIDGMHVAQELYDNNLTPGQYVLQLLQKGKKYVPEFYKSDLENELQRIWDVQSVFYPEILTEEFKHAISGKGRNHVAKIFYARYEINTADNKGADKRKQTYLWRVEALINKLELDALAYVICDLCGNISSCSGYLGAIGDRSKELLFNKMTVGQYLLQIIDTKPNESLSNIVFYRQDYLDEFERIWQCQSQFHHELTPELKKEIRDIIIFYQRPLKSKKSMLDTCTFENRVIKVIEDGKEKEKTVGLKVVPKSSPLFQEFKIWQILNNIAVIDVDSDTKTPLTQEQKEMLAKELELRPKMSKNEVLKTLFKKTKGLDLNYKDVEGNTTMHSLYNAYMVIAGMTGHDELDVKKEKSEYVKEYLEQLFKALGYKTNFLSFYSELEGHEFEKQAAYQLWHLLYSYEGDNSKTGNEKLIQKLMEITGFDYECAKVLANITFKEDYGSLSSKAIRKILPYMKAGNEYSIACSYAGYKHSERSRTKEELESRVYLDRLQILPKNSLRNPVVEKILNQMINVINNIIDVYGKPDEIRIEMARELKNSAKEREDMNARMREMQGKNEEYRKKLQTEFNLSYVSKNDILRYRLYEELKGNNYHTLYSNTYISKEKLFSKEFDIEHIIPQARLFDDSFSNKTLEARNVNIEKGSTTAWDYIKVKYNEEEQADYRNRINNLYKEGAIGKAKRNKLLMSIDDIPNDFIDRDLRDTQYIARKAREILEDLVPEVVPTTGSITDRLREDWQLINVMQELNWQKYDTLGLTEVFEDHDGKPIHRITDWTKRNDHRHHAMDALTIAFTKRTYINYLNNLNARSHKESEAYAIEKKHLERDAHGRLRFIPPMPLDEFRNEAKRQLENILVSIKAKNKVTTRNVNRTKSRAGLNKKVQLTPRGQLHNETIYGHTLSPMTRIVKVNAKLTQEMIEKVTSGLYRIKLLERLEQFGGDSKKAFTGKNTLDKNPIFLNESHTQRMPGEVKVLEYIDNYPIKKNVDASLNVDKVMDEGVKRILLRRLEEYNGDAKKAFSNLDENPIWLNEEKGIAIKSVRVSGLANATALHKKKDHRGAFISDNKGKRIDTDYVNTGNNHHVAIFKDEKGDLHEHVVSFLEATERVNRGLPIIDRKYNEEKGWEFLFTMKQNEYFVFPSEEFNPTEIDLLDPKNAYIVGKHLYRVQACSNCDYYFRHHLETTVEYNNKLKGITWLRLKSTGKLKGVVKVRVNHIGQVVSIGEE